MKIKQLSVTNFRLLEDITINVEDDITLIVGKNNSGKTTIITALDKIINNQKFAANDFNFF